MIATADAANCGNESSQLRPNHRLKNERWGSVFVLTRFGSSASIELRMRSHSACSFGGASYTPRCVRQKPTIDARSWRTLSQSKHSLRCVLRVNSSLCVIAVSYTHLTLPTSDLV